MTASPALEDYDQAGRTRPARFRFIGLEQLEHQPKPTELVEGLVPDPALTFLLGAPGSGKSLLALDLALSVATFQEQWFGQKLRHGPVIYAADEGFPSLGRRANAWRSVNRKAEGPIAFCDRLPDLCDTQSVLDFVEAIVSRPMELPVLVVLDTFSRAIPGADENSAQEMSRAVASLDYIRAELNSSVLCVHHTGKDRTRGARGSSVLSAAADAELQLESVDGIREFRPTKQRDGTLDLRLRFGLVPALGSVYLTLSETPLPPERLTERQQAALRALGGLSRPASAAAWQQATDLPQRTFYDAVRVLTAAEEVVKTSRGYILAGERRD